MRVFFMNNWMYIAFEALAIAVAVCIYSAVRRRALERQISRMGRVLDASMRQLGELSRAMEQRQENLRGAVSDRLDSMRDSNDQRFDQLRLDMSTRLDRRLGDSFRTVNEQLARVDKGLGEMRNLVGDVGDLKRILTNPRARGAWGEVQLRGILEDTLAPGQYLENTAVEKGAAERVEFAIVMPDASGEQVLLPVDSKFPVESYLRMDENDGAAFEKRVLEEAKRISAKYIRPPHTMDYAVMFLPAESVYAEVARRRGLVERVQNDYRVLISGPATFAALITSLRLGYRGLAVERHGAEVMALLHSVQDEFSKYAETVSRARQRARQLETELDALEVRARAVERSLRDVGEGQ